MLNGSWFFVPVRFSGPQNGLQRLGYLTESRYTRGWGGAEGWKRHPSDASLQTISKLPVSFTQNVPGLRVSYRRLFGTLK